MRPSENSPIPNTQGQVLQWLPAFLGGSVFGAILTLFSLYLTFHELSFERDQRSIEIILELSDSWESNFDKDTRRYFVRFIEELEQFNQKLTMLNNKLKETKENSNSTNLTINIENQIEIWENERKNFLEVFANEEYINIKMKDIIKIEQIKNTKLANGESILNFLEVDDQKNNLSVQLSEKISLYRTSLIRSLNRLESVALIQQEADTKEVKRIIDVMYGGSIKKRCKQLQSFVERYNYFKYTLAKETYKAWIVLYNGKPGVCSEIEENQ